VKLQKQESLQKKSVSVTENKEHFIIRMRYYQYVVKMRFLRRK